MVLKIDIFSFMQDPCQIGFKGFHFRSSRKKVGTLSLDFKEIGTFNVDLKSVDIRSKFALSFYIGMHLRFQIIILCEINI